MLKKTIAIFVLFMLTFTAVAAYAAPAVTKHAKAPAIVVSGKLEGAYGGEMITIKALKADEIAHIGFTQCDDEGNYFYKFTTNYNANDITVYVNQGGNDLTSQAVITTDSAKIHEVNLTITNEQNVPFHYGVDTKCVLNAEISNVYGGEDNYVLILGFYDENGSLIKALTKNCSMTFNKEGKLQSNEFTVEDVPAKAAKIKGFIFDTLETVKPLANNALYVEQEMHGLNNINNESGELVIAYLGGSITGGAGATSKDNRYSTLVTNWFSEKYPNKTVTEHNAGIGGTGSKTALVRLEKDVIEAKPDIVFVEFAVNDQNPSEAIRNERAGYYEDVISRLIKLEKQPVIIPIFSPSYKTGYPTTGGDTEKYNASYLQQSIADNYGIETIDFASYVGTLYENGTWTDWRANFPDGTHPNDATYKEYADYITGCLEANPEKYYKKIASTTERLMPESGYNTPELIPFNSDRITYTGDWTTTAYGKNYVPFYPDGYYNAPKAGGTLTMEFSGTVFGIYGMYAPVTMAGGTYNIDDGKYVGELPLTKDPGVVEYTIEAMECLLLKDLDDGKHTVTITFNPTTTERPYPSSLAWVIVDEK